MRQCLVDCLADRALTAPSALFGRQVCTLCRVRCVCLDGELGVSLRVPIAKDVGLAEIRMLYSGQTKFIFLPLISFYPSL